MAYPDEVLADNPASYWRLGEASGTFADSADSNPSAAVGAGVTYGTQQLQISDANTSAGFNGTSGFIRIDDAVNLQITGALSLEALIRIDGLPAASNEMAIVAKHLVPNVSGYALGVYSDGSPSARVLMVVRGGGASSELRSQIGSITQGNIYHVVGTYDEAGDDMVIYVNGVQNNITGSATTVLAVGTGSDVNIGARADGTGNGDQIFFNGLIDEVAIYPTVLSSARVLAHYQASRDYPAPIAWISA